MTLRAAAATTLLALLGLTPLHADRGEMGLNLPATKGSSNAGNFEPGVFPFHYTDEIRQRIANSHFTHLRLSLNVETALDEQALNELEKLAALVNYRGILCMWDTNLPSETGHGNGLPNDLRALAAAWKNVHATFGKYPNLRYEIFNEPFGYPSDAAGAQRYLDDMRAIIEQADLPVERCLLDGLGYADDIRLLVEAGWIGPLAYHIYPNWLPANRQSVEHFERLLISELDGIANEIVITEFGASLRDENYESSPRTGQVSLLDGMRNAIKRLRARSSNISGTYHWHGWDNGDAYSFWAQKNANGANAVRTLQNELQNPSKP